MYENSLNAARTVFTRNLELQAALLGKERFQSDDLDFPCKKLQEEGK